MLKVNLVTITFILIGITAFSQATWQKELNEELAKQGHRNWILVVDAAYPYQSKPAIKTVVTGEDQLEVVKQVLEAIESAPHVAPEIFLDKEIDFVPNSEAKGINKYRNQLYRLLDDEKLNKKLHEELIADIDDAAQLFHILVLKTNLTLPYTSVFIRLDCGYWNADQENKLRDLMK